jgi:hypothetical protein
MTGTTVQLPRTLAVLIESRLDTIDRMLLGRMARGDRLAIVREVESQVYDLLAECETAELTRDDVLAVLARLDPPEAYLAEEPPDDAAGWSAPTHMRIAPAPRTSFQPRVHKDYSKTGLLSGILGILALVMILLTPIPWAIGTYFQNEFVMLFGWGAEAIISFALSTSAIVLAIYARMRSAWAVIGVATSALSLLFTFLGGGLLLVEIVG